MTVVRELVTRLGFQVDRSGLNIADRAIQAFKSRIVFTASSIKDFIFETASYLGEVAKANIEVKDLARNTKLSVEEFVELRKAAQEFRFEPAQFDIAFEKLAELLGEAKSGYGELFDIIRKSKGELDLTSFIEAGDVKGAFLEVIDYIRSLKDVREQLRVIRDIFGPGNENGILRIVEAGGEAFLKAAESNREFAKSFAEGIPEQEKYLQNINKITKEFEDLKQTAAQVLTGPASFGIQTATEGLKGFSVLSEQSEEGGFFSAIKFLGAAVSDAIQTALGGGLLKDLQNEMILEDDREFYRRYAEHRRQQQVNGPITINNTVEVNVDPATDLQQRQSISEVVASKLNEIMNEKVREVISNNPQVE